MVKMEKIVIQGFKSFKRKVSIPLPSGFSVVTGPNGSGKSNIGDAISFVLGRTSSRTLRAKKTQNLVFHGSKKKSGADFAKVSVYFDNSKKIIPVEEKEVSISRRINKKGVSTYRLNGKVITRHQVVDIFAQAGIHPDGHNIIQQGDVNHIVEMDAIGRREIIDEISGIAEYDDKKRKAEKELEQIDGRIRESEIILQEKFQVIEKMRQERDAALKYKKHDDELNAVRAAMVWKDFSGAKKGLESATEKLESRENEMKKLEKEIEDCDQKITKEEEKLDGLTKQVLKASEQMDVTNRITKLRSDLERKQDKIDSNMREIERLQSLVERLSQIDTRMSPAFKSIENLSGVFGMISNLITVPANYRVAVEVAGGGHLSDIVVDTTSNVIKCVKHLKANKIGRARFLPLDKVRGMSKPLPTGAQNWVSELVKYDRRHEPVMSYVFGSTALVKNADRAGEIAKKNRVRMVTLDGDLFEASGAITGGFYKKRAGAGTSIEVSRYMAEKKKLEAEIDSMHVQMKGINEDLEILAEKEKRTKIADIERDRMKLDQRLHELRSKRKDAYEKRVDLQQDISRLNIQKARLEAKSEDLKFQWDEKEEIDEEIQDYVQMSVTKLKELETNAIEGIQALGPVNMKALDEFEMIRTEFEDFREKVDKIVSEKNSIMETVKKIENKRKETFAVTMNSIAKHFRDVYMELTQGEADLELIDPNNLDSGLIIKAQPPGKKLLHIDSMSGGEKTLTAFAFLFAVQRFKPTPFYILDEADATLDKENTRRVVGLIKKQSKLAQFIVISHNDALVRGADQIYGISMEDGESKIVGIELPPSEKVIEKEKQKNN
jgi:chromosome segregation protein